MCRRDADCRSFEETCVNGMCLRTNLPRDDVATYLEDEYTVHSTTTDFYDDYEIDNADEEVLDVRVVASSVAITTIGGSTGTVVNVK